MDVNEAEPNGAPEQKGNSPGSSDHGGRAQATRDARSDKGNIYYGLNGFASKHPLQALERRRAKDEVTVSGQVSEIGAPEGVAHRGRTLAGDGASIQAEVTAVSDRHRAASEIKEIDFAELVDGSLVEMIENPEDSSASCLAVCIGKEVRITNELEGAGKRLTSISRNSGYIRHILLPNGVAPYESVQSLLVKIHTFLGKCLDVAEYERILLTTFVVATWFIDRLPVAPYIALVGLPGSGKSTVLKLLSLICRRSLLTADISSAGFYQVCDQLTPTLLIDETATAGNRRSLFHLLRTGTSRDAVALRKNQSFQAFGAKVVAWVELPHDAALNSRCVVISLNETHRTDLLRPRDPRVMTEAEILRRQLLQYRLENLNTVSLKPTPGDENLTSRSRDLFQAFALAAGPWRQTLARMFTDQQALTREPLFPVQAAVLSYLYHRIHGPRNSSGELDTVKSLTDLVNRSLGLLDESIRLNPREVGAALTTLGISRRKRCAQGFMVVLTSQDRQKIHDLVGIHGIDIPGFWPSFESCRNCPLCANLPHPYYGSAFQKGKAAGNSPECT